MLISPEEFAGELFGSLKLPQQGKYFVAYSGGVDSTVLLHLMHALAQQYPISVVALHANHNLQTESSEWSRACESFCSNLGIEFRSTSLKLVSDSENDARNARYSWMRDTIDPGSVLLTAHHQQDRSETFLFNLLRGAGSAGLSSLRAVRPFFGARLARPLLSYSKEQIVAYARSEQLSWIEDPSNSDTRYTRNKIRQDVLPILNQVRPDAVQNITRAAANLERENSLMREVAIADLVEVREQCKHPLDGSYALCTDDLVFLSPARQANLIRFWLHSLNLHTPSQRFLDQLLAAIDKPPTATAVLQEGGFQFRFYKGFMYVMRAEQVTASFSVLDWQNPNQPVALYSDQLRVDATPKLRDLLVRDRKASLRLASRNHLSNPKALQGHSLNLKKWLQDIGVPPWRRQSLPLLTLVKNNQDVVLAPVDHQLQNDWVTLDQVANY